MNNNREYTEQGFLEDEYRVYINGSMNDDELESYLDNEMAKKMSHYRELNKELLTKYDGLDNYITEAINEEINDESTDESSDLNYVFSVALENGEDNYFDKNENMDQDYYNDNVFKLKEWI